MKNFALLTATALTLSLSLAGCGGGDEDKAAEAIAASMMENNDETLTLDQDQADCVGEGFVDEIGVDQLQEYGMLTEDLQVSSSPGELSMDEGDADDAADVVMDCVDAQKMMADQFAADGSLTDDQKDCLEDALDDDALKQMFSLIFQGKDEDATSDLMEPVMSCLA